MFCIIARLILTFNSISFSSIQVQNTPMRPKEFALSQLSKMIDTKFLTNNHSGSVVSPKLVYNIKQEAKKKLQHQKGIYPGESDVGNIMRVVERTEKADLARRQVIGDTSQHLLGVTRKVTLVPNLNIYLHSREMLNLAGSLSSVGRLVISIDATGGLLNIRDTQADGKIQHTLLTIQCTECVIKKEDSSKYGSNFLITPAIIAERVSSRNRASDFYAWLIQVKKDTETAMTSYLGQGYGYPMRPVCIKMDCALELMNGCIAAFREPSQVLYASMYNSCVIIALLRHESKLSISAQEIHSELAESCLQLILVLSPCIMKQCKTHVYRAIKDYPKKNKNNLPTEMKIWARQFEELFAHVANEATNITSISQVMSRLSVIVTILSTEYLSCGQFTNKSDTQKHHSRWISSHIAKEMDKIITEQVEEIQIDNDSDRDDMLRHLFHNNPDHEDRPFSGKIYCQPIVDRMMGKLEGKQSMLFSVQYLSDVTSRKKGRVNIVYIYSPYTSDENGEESVSPQFIGGVTVEVNLPCKSNIIRNPLFSPVAVRYLMDYWLNRIGLWSNSVIDVANTAMDANIYSCNQSIEGTICQEKNGVSTVSEDMKDIANLISRRAEDVVKLGRLLSNQIDTAQDTIERRKTRQSIRQVILDDDGVNMESEMVWKRTPGTTRAQLRYNKERMMLALHRGMSNGKFQYTESVVTSMWRILCAHALTIDLQFMGIAVFKEWTSDKRTNPLKKVWTDVIDHFHRTHS